MFTSASSEVCVWLETVRTCTPLVVSSLSNSLQSNANLARRWFSCYDIRNAYICDVTNCIRLEKS